MNRNLLIVILITIFTTGCASNKSAQERASAHSDPLESVNRVVWDFNRDVLDEHLLKPVTVAYIDNMPEGLRTGVYNAALNLDEPGNFVNNLLQGKLGASFESAGRFVINSTIGLLGLVDVADDMGLERQTEDFGQTLGVWGVGTGPYLMLPVLGPSDPRSFTGEVVDRLYWPINDLNIYLNVFSTSIKVVEARASLLAQDQLIYDSLDSYSFVKDIYFQSLASQVADGVLEDSDEFSEEDEELDALLEDF